MSFFVVISLIRESLKYFHDIGLYRQALSYWRDGRSPAVVVLWCQSARQRPGALLLGSWSLSTCANPACICVIPGETGPSPRAGWWYCSSPSWWWHWASIPNRSSAEGFTSRRSVLYSAHLSRSGTGGFYLLFGAWIIQTGMDPERPEAGIALMRCWT